MSDNQVLRAWEEIVISQEKGNRIVHYLLKDSTGNSLLAVVGKDRSVNHMSYVVSEDYLRVFGPTSHVHAGTKWRARRDVVNWLIWLVSSGGPILSDSNNPSSLKCQVSQKSNNGEKLTEELEGSGQPAIMQASKRIKSCTLVTNVASDGSAVKWEPNHKKLKTELPSKGPNIIKLVVPEAQCRVLSKFHENIELLSQDSGLHGCWFRCKILHSSQDCLMVRYKDVLEVDGSGKLEDWVPASRVAARDRLGMRCVGRLTVRPSACENSSDITFVVGAAVDAWWCNGWWEGVVIGCDTLEKSNIQVYFPGENRFLTIARKNVRISRDWIDGKWVNIKAKPDILSFLSSIFSTGKKLPPISISAEAYSSKLANGEVVNPRTLEGSKDDKRWPPSSSPSDKPQDVEELNLKKRLIRRYNEEMSHGNSG